MIVMLPIMFAARKLDGEDPTTLYYVRIAYFSVQAILMVLVIYIYAKASSLVKGRESLIIYVPSAPSLFADPEAKKKYTETTYGAHVMSEARGLLGSTFFGMLFTCGMHYFRNMIMGLAMQSVMGPINMMEKPLVTVLLTGPGTIKPEDRVFGEKTADELTADDEIVDSTGNPVVRQIKNKSNSSATPPTGAITSNDAFEKLLLDTWDSGEKADLGPLMQIITKKNCNYQTKENSWTPLMILAGLGVKGTASAMKQVIELGGNPAITDKDGWNAMHWSAFHGSAEAAKVLAASSPKLATVNDKEGKIPELYAKAEGHNDVFKILQAIGETSAEPAVKSESGLRKRK
eukprot:CAMPEP_0202456614 /NCGR_PEP_ID=MMETSP1360-20130828/13827_1 /ASSEMBLY_ACC=CAM_ASM_000848 /TAXON_ID=515479 /ORGANISM="Licmophora paradoxa, Strain CCMP2313" /LENGTH=345 /DNA_ID=CAMNT_0049076471 /DNA_START=21 /DNA_END=1058 /DNA_ORIENTATION=-